MASSTCSVDQFAEVLSPEGLKWFDVGIFLGASTAELKEIQHNYSTNGVVRCLIELHYCLVKKARERLAWDNIVIALRRLGNNALADSIHSSYILPAVDDASSDKDSISTAHRSPMSSNGHVAHSSDPHQHPVVIKDGGVDDMFRKLHLLSNRFDSLALKIGRSLKTAPNINIEEMQKLVTRQCGLPPLPQNEATVETVFSRLQEKCSVLMFYPLTFVVDNLLTKKKTTLLRELKKLEKDVSHFKKSEKMVAIVSRINSHPNVDKGKKVKLKLRDSWMKFTMEQFEIMINEILGTLYDVLSHITVGTGCICVSWNIPPSVDYTKLLPKLSIELLEIIGVISLHIGGDVIYNVGEEGCQTLEAAMLQAIELKNTLAIELLLAVGCSAEVAVYYGDCAVTNVVNIRETSVDDGSGGGVNHVCVLGQNEHIDAIVDTSREPKCAGCKAKETQIAKLNQQVSDKIQQKKKNSFSAHDGKKDAGIEELTGELKQKADEDLNLKPKIETKYEVAKKDAKIQELTKQLKEKDKLSEDLSLEIEKLSSKHDTNQAKKDAEIQELTEQLKEKVKLADTLQLKIVTLSLDHGAMRAQKDIPLTSSEQIKTKAFTAQKRNFLQQMGGKFSKDVEEEEIQNPKKQPLSCTAVLPHQRLLGIGTEMKVKVITRAPDSDGKQLTNGGSAVRASLTCNKEECPVTDNGDGTYLVSVIPQQFGQHHLSITVNAAHIKDSPFSLNIIPKTDYTRLKEPSEIIGIRNPKYIAFSDNGDMFVTSSDHCIYVYDKSGNRKATIGSKGTGELQFQHPNGIDISNGEVYVTEYSGHRIHMLTTQGGFVGTFGKRGFGIGQFNCPHDIKINPDGRVYIADTYNERVQVFNPDWTISHVIDRTSVPDVNRFTLDPTSIVFDQSGDVRVTVTDSSSVTVFTPTGKFVRRYGESEIGIPLGIAIDPSGYSLVTSRCNNTVSVYDPSGELVHSIEGFHFPHGVSVSPDGSVWVADTINDRLAKYYY